MEKKLNCAKIDPRRGVVILSSKERDFRTFYSWPKNMSEWFDYALRKQQVKPIVFNLNIAKEFVK